MNDCCEETVKKIRRFWWKKPHGARPDEFTHYLEKLLERIENAKTT